jgi:recombination protein RecT
MAEKSKNELVKFSGVLKNSANQSLLQGALTHGLDMNRFVKSAWIQVTTNEDIKELAVKNPSSVFKAMLQCAQMGLYPDGQNGDAYLVKFGNQCVAIRGYRGLMRLFSDNNPDAASMPVVFDKICENDEWDYERGASPMLTHKPSKTDRGKTTHYYAAARFRDGSVWPKVMTVEEVEGFSKYAKTDKFWNSPHQNTKEWMRIKTVVRQLFKEVPLPNVSREQLEQEDAVERGIVNAERYLEIVADSTSSHVEGAEIRKTETKVIDDKKKNPTKKQKDGPPPELKEEFPKEAVSNEEGLFE